MKKVVNILLLLLGFVHFSYAQKNNDCAIYSAVLDYFNKKEAGVKYVYKGIVNPVSGDLGKRVERTGIHQLSFYIIKNKSRFDNNDVKYWFSQLVKDSILKRYKYVSNTDSVVDCSFACCLKYQYRDFEEVREFTNDDFSMDVKGTDTTYYTPIRITLSKVLYVKNIALVYTKVFSGLGNGRDMAVYGFVFMKKGKEWTLHKVEVETN